MGFGVDGDEFAVAPDAGVVLVGYGEAVDGVAHGCELVGYVCGEFLFEVDAVGQVLVVEAGGVGGLLDVEAVVDGADDVVGDGGDDGGAAGGAHDVGEMPCLYQWPGVVRMVGVMAESGRLPGAMELAELWMRPNMLGTPILEVKSSISLFMRKPRPSTVTPEPKPPLRVVGGGDGVAVGVDDGVVGGLGGLFCGRGLRWRGHEAGGADEVFAGCGFGGVDGAAPGRGVFGLAICLRGRVLKSGSPR